MKTTVLLDSSFKGLAVGLARGDEMIDRTEYDAWQKQSELLVPELDNLLRKNHCSRADIGDIVVTVGPGSYTGVRIAISVAKVMALALQVPVYALSSLHVLTEGDNPTIVLINARSERSYIGVYQGSQILLADTVVSNTEALAWVHDHPTYAISGDTAYLGISGKTVSPLDGMLRLKQAINPVTNPLGLTPVYLKG